MLPGRYDEFLDFFGAAIQGQESGGIGDQIIDNNAQRLKDPLRIAQQRRREKTETHCKRCAAVKVSEELYYTSACAPESETPQSGTPIGRLK